MSPSCIGCPFSSTKEVHLDMENGTFLFVQFDLVQVYFKFRVAEESMHLLVFIFPFGKYAMLGMSME